MDGERNTNLKIDLDSPKEAESDSGKEEDAKIAGRKKRVIMGYKAIIASYVAMAAFAFSQTGLSPFFLFYTFGNVSLPAGTAYIMISAAENDRLKSDTYKRLNLALLGYGVVGLSTTATKKFLYIPFLLSIVNSVKGYTYGVLGWDKKNSDTSLVSDLVTGAKRTIAGFLSVPKDLKSFGYSAALLLVGSMTLIPVKDIFTALQAGESLHSVSFLLSKFARYAFLSVALYTLKDAAERDRLGGTSFIQLNYLSALVMSANSVWLGGFANKVGTTAAGFAGFFVFNGLSSYFERNTV
jgi:uncharacterized membrane protein (UPF0136 family)